MKPKLQLILFALVMIAMAGLFGCNAEKHNQNRRDRLTAKFDRLKYKADRDSVLIVVPPLWVAKNYPGRTEYIPGEPVLIKGKPDTVLQHDTVQVKCPDNSIVKVPCPPTRIITIRDTVRVVDTVKKVDSAAMRVMQNEVIAANKDLLKADKATESMGKEAIKAQKSALRGWIVATILGLIAAVEGLTLWAFIRGKAR